MPERGQLAVPGGAELDLVAGFGTERGDPPFLPAEARLRRPVAIKKARSSGSSCDVLDSSFVLPVRSDLRTRLVQMNVLIDMIDPGHWDEVVMLSIG